ncbi:syntaxin-6-like [Ctenocephalides felis]|uniref:syntaxin-6-like n=1 Tax=Ctenocephalides felis TaxID=7515 RepID=UPI000E6E3B2A|nr:syntaxin-6-like [Ctenocephalides felis]XP_026461766.1 syntaxin-6-like [Ctenocephalides felis]
MSLEDPFFVVKDEVFKALNKTRGLYLRWLELGDASSSLGSAEAEWTTTELRNALRSIEWDLEDLEDTISIVEKNPSKFKIDNRELSSRRNFIDSTRHEVKSMKDKMSFNRSSRTPLLENSSTSIIMNNSSSQQPRHSSTKYSKLENNIDDMSPRHYASRNGNGGFLDSPSHSIVGENVSLQQRMIRGQDEQLDVLSDSIGTLKTVSRQIGAELDEQAVMLDDFGHEIEGTESKLDSTMKKIATAMHLSNDKRQWIAIGVLSVILLIVIILFLV